LFVCEDDEFVIWAQSESVDVWIRNDVREQGTAPEQSRAETGPVDFTILKRKGVWIRYINIDNVKLLK
jgi:hypothetical protein